MSKLAAIATHGKVYGIDHSTESVAMAMRTNKQWIDIARVEVREASVSRLPFSEGAFDVITAVETHFWWPALPTDMREVLRVLKPGGRLIIIAEVYKGAAAFTSKAAERYSEKNWYGAPQRRGASRTVHGCRLLRRPGHYGTKQRVDLLHREQASSFITLRHNFIAHRVRQANRL